MIGVTLLILAIFNGFAGYSLLDDQLSGTGLRIAYSIALVDPGRRDVDHVAAVRRRVPGCRHHPAALRDPHPAAPGADHRAAERAPVPRRAPQAHAVRRAGRRGATTSSASGCGRRTRRRRVGLFFLTAAVLCFLGGLVQINPIWVFGPFNPAEVSARRHSPTGTWAGSTARCASCRAGRSGRSASRSRTRSSRRAARRRSRSCCCTCGRSSRRGSPATSRSTTSLDRPRQRPVRTALGVGDALVLLRCCSSVRRRT